MSRQPVIATFFALILVAACNDEAPIFFPFDVGSTDDASSGDTTATDIEPGDVGPPSDGGSDADQDAAEDVVETDVGPDTPAGRCGDGNIDDGELCDGDNLGDSSCESLGFDSGELACAADCLSHVTEGCESECVPDCSSIECGPDPNCGIACGTCARGDCVDGFCTGPSDAGPEFITFNTNVRELSEGETILFTAVVTDPDGIDNLIGGTLMDPVSGGSYGAFATSAAEGAYELELSWGAMQRVRSIDFLEGEITREYEAEFFDVEGHRASRRISITLHCDGDAACEGVCTDISTVDDCGGCGIECADGGECEDAVCICPDGEGVCEDECIDWTSTENCGGCGIECATGASCDGGACACPDGEAVCDGACIDITTTDNCGGCGVECAIGGSCRDMTCVCDAGWDVCDGICTDFGTVTDCGGCDVGCMDGGLCDETGTCVCPVREDNCDGTCTPIDTVDDCGGCGIACPTRASCVGGFCECPPGWGVCGGSCRNLGTISNCGGCDIRCASGASCSDGTCECPAGQAVCDGACTPTDTDTNCGGCGIVCGGGTTCTEGRCLCPDGGELCDGVCTDTSTVTDCGGCGVECPSGASCFAAIGCACPSGHVVCDGACVDVTVDERCGDCTTSCLDAEMGHVCVDGACECDIGERECPEGCESWFDPVDCGPTCGGCLADQTCDGNGCVRRLLHDLRLNLNGNLEIYDGGGWGIVCDTGFDAVEAAVACRQLGGTLLDWEGGQYDGNARRTVTNVECLDDEVWLGGCSRTNMPGVAQCESGDAVRLVCEPGPAPSPACSHPAIGDIVINEVSPSGTTDFIELAADPGTILAGLHLIVVDAAGFEADRFYLPAATVDETGLYVLGNTGVPADHRIATALPTSGGIILRGCSGERLDAIAFGYPAVDAGGAQPGEGTPAPAIEEGASWGRDVDSTDTDNNAEDFTDFLSPTPGFPNDPEIVPLILPTVWSGSIAEGAEPTSTRADHTCTFPTSVAYPYIIREVRNRTLSTYNLNVSTTQRDYVWVSGGWGGSYELRNVSAYVFVYHEPITEGAPWTNCELGDGGTYPSIDFDLAPDETKYIVYFGATDGMHEYTITLDER